MIDTPKITTTESLITAMIHLTIPRSEIQKVMGPGLKELQAVLDAQGIKATGPWFTHHLRMDPKVFDFEICLPVAAPVKVTGRVRPGSAPAMKAARTIYNGGYEGLGAAWGELNDWIAAQGLPPAEDLWERYLSGPESGADTAKWRTELTRPLTG